MVCSVKPLTGYYRDGCCNAADYDLGTHIVCAVMTNEFLEFSFYKGNDLITPRPEFMFPGLKVGDKWCLCVSRWVEAYRSGLAPKLILEATHEKTLNFVPLHELMKFAFVSNLQ